MSDPYKRDMRKGRWQVAREVLLNYRNQHWLKMIQGDVLIVGTHYDILTDTVEFHGTSERFDVIDESCIVPLYKPMIETGCSDVIVHWEKVA